MRNSKISKILMLIITCIVIVCVHTTVFADEPVLDFSGDFSNSSTTGNEVTGNNVTVQPENTTNDGAEDLTNSLNTTTNTNTNTSTNTNSNTNTSTYEETDIPYAGPEDTILMATAFIVCAIIGIYTFMKLSDYSNI